MSRQIVFSVGFCLFALAGASQTVAGVVLDPTSYVSAQAFGVTGGPYPDTVDIDPGLPSLGSLTADYGGELGVVLSSTTTYNFAQTSTQATFGWQYSHAYSGVRGHSGTISEVTFSVDTDSTYAVSGTYAYEAPLETISWSFYQLADVTPPATIHYLGQATNWGPFTHSGVFDLTTGNGYYDDIGSATGMLLAGHTYSFRLESYIEQFYPEDGPATAFGSASLIVTAVPEPATAVLTAVGLAGVGLFRARVRRTRLNLIADYERRGSHCKPPRMPCTRLH